MKLNQAIKLLDECEKSLRKLLAEAASDGDYSSVLRITDWAKAIAALAAEGQPATLLGTAPQSHITEAAGVAKDAGTGRAPFQPGALGSVRGLRPSPDDYPKFFRRGDELMKIGWSKKDRKEYKHRAPRRAVDAVAATVRQVGAKGKLFSGDALLPLKDPADGTAVPDYQAYVALAWLKHLGVVRQRGRRSGYSLMRDKQIDSTITAAWPALPEWRG